jgi:hypothetical protein
MPKDLEKLNIELVNPNFFKLIIENVCQINERFRVNLDKKHNYQEYDCYLAEDVRFGFCVNQKTQELSNVFSIEKKRGKEILAFATNSYNQLRLNCFDGYLKEFYTKFGFTEVKRVANYISGGPDVVFLEYKKEDREKNKPTPLLVTSQYM